MLLLDTDFWGLIVKLCCFRRYGGIVTNISASQSRKHGFESYLGHGHVFSEETDTC
jgi:hypothetical protein